MDLHFEAKRDLWLTLVIWLAALVLLATGVKGFRTDRFLFSSVLVVFAAAILWILYGTRYTLTQDRLIVRSGPLRWKIPLESIVSIEPSRDPIASPATSLDRLEIRYAEGRKQLLVSPLRKEEFCAALAAARHAAD